MAPLIPMQGQKTHVCHTTPERGKAWLIAMPSTLQAHNANMEFVLSDHAKEEAQRRQIPMEWIESTMAHPEQMTPGANRRKVFQSRIVTNGKTYLVRLVVEDWHQPPVIVTVYRTGKIDKYWGKT